jgi:hypothetical protein
MLSAQALSEADRRVVATWAADCAERVLMLFEAEAPTYGRRRDAIARTRAFAEGELDTAGEIRRRFLAGRAAHALGAAAYAAQAAGLAALDQSAAVSDEISWQLENMNAQVRVALQQLPPLGEDSAGPLGSGLLASGVLGSNIRKIQFAVGKSSPREEPR